MNDISTVDETNIRIVIVKDKDQDYWRSEVLCGDSSCTDVPF